jgi:hypothetical protein
MRNCASEVCAFGPSWNEGSPIVPGLDPSTPSPLQEKALFSVDCRVKSGNDELRTEFVHAT